MRRLILGLAAFSIASAAMASTDPVKDTRQILAGTVTTKATKNAYLSGAKDGTTAFQGALSAYKAVRAAEVPAPAPASANPCGDAHGMPIAGSTCPARMCPGNANPVPVEQPCPVAIKP